MKMELEDQDIITGGTLVKKNFAVANSSKLFRILSDKLYSNKIGSIVRELSSNALDAHSDAGKKDKPFKVTITRDQFIIRDYGTGMDDEKVLNLYTTYTESDKAHNDDALGCYGLGSKSPFAYTKSFTVVTYCGGQRTTWAALIGPEGIPEIHLMGKVTCNAEDGLQVSFSLLDNPIGTHNDFIREAQNLYKWFTVKPNANFTIPVRANPLITGTGWEVTSDKECHVVMGNIPYTIAHPLSNHRYGINYYVNIGEVDVPPSREMLEMTEKTKKKLDDMKKLLLKEYEDKIKADLAKEISDFARAIKFVRDYNQIDLVSNPYPEDFTLPMQVSVIDSRGKSRKRASFAVSGQIKVYVADKLGTRGYVMSLRKHAVVIDPEEIEAFMKVVPIDKSEFIYGSTVVPIHPKTPGVKGVNKFTVHLWDKGTRKEVPFDATVTKNYIYRHRENLRSNDDNIDSYCSYGKAMAFSHLMPFYEVNVKYCKKMNKLGCQFLNIKAESQKILGEIETIEIYGADKVMSNMFSLRTQNQEVADFITRINNVKKKYENRTHKELDYKVKISPVRNEFTTVILPKYPILKLLPYVSSEGLRIIGELL